MWVWYSRVTVPGHKNWQIKTAVWNLAGFLNCTLETRWQQFGQFLIFSMIFLMIFLMIFSMKILTFSMKISIFSVIIVDFVPEKS